MFFFFIKLREQKKNLKNYNLFKMI